MLELIESLPLRWREAVWGALVGDSLGVPHEFKAGRDVPLANAIEMRMPQEYPKTYGAIPYGTWSDDGSQMLALLSTLQAGEGHYDATLFGKNLLSWMREARFQAGGVVFDCGIQTRHALEALAEGAPVVLDPNACGNGSLMRVLPVAALPDWFGISEQMALAAAMAQSAITHPNRKARVICALYVELCWEVAGAWPVSWSAAVARAGARLRERGVLSAQGLAALSSILDYEKTAMPTGSGYALNTFWSAIWALEGSGTISEALRKAISLGNDTDTVACVTGGLAGAAQGLDAKARQWRGELCI
jgi:ADP-ribosylglycohydrolase